MSDKKTKLRTSKEIYHRILWDSQLSAEEYVIGYEERFDGLSEIALSDFDPDGDIPWHRIQCIRGPNGVVWDRRERLDLLSSPAHHLDESDALSDHMRQLAPVHTSAVVIVPPRYLWPRIQELRAQYDRHYPRWMPHITVLYGFVGAEHHGLASEFMARALADMAPFAVALDRFAWFEHKRSSTVYLVPESAPAGALEALQERLQALFPRCDEQTARGFTPHLTVGQGRGQAGELNERWRAQWSPVSFDVSEVHLISRAQESPFVVTHRVPLGGTPSSGSSPVDALVHGRSRRERSDLRAVWEPVLSQVEVACRAIDEAAMCHLSGSLLMGIDDRESDVDVICATTEEISRETFFSSVNKLLRKGGHLERSRSVHDAIVPVLKLRVDGVDIDLSQVSCPAGVLSSELHTLSSKTLRHLDLEGRRTALGLVDTLSIVDAVTPSTGMKAFERLARAVRVWAKARSIFSHAIGYLGGFSWALLTAWCLRERAATTASTSTAELLSHFFDSLSRWDWEVPIGLTPAARRYEPMRERDSMSIVTSTPPVTNSARAVTSSTFAVLKAEIDRGRRLAERCLRGQGEWEELFASVDAESSCPAQVVFDVSVKADDDRAICIGWIQQQVISLIREIEEEHDLEVRPFPKGPTLGLMVPRTAQLEADLDPTLEAFSARFARWSARPAGANLKSEVRARLV